jgi:putative oxidoreductase
MRRLFSTGTSDSAFSFATLLLRLGVGFLMLLNHGYNKLIHFSSYAQKFADPFHIGRTPSLALTIFAEVFCSVFIILGLFTRLATIPLIIAMTTAFVFAHNANYRSGPGGGEMALLFLTGYIVLLFTGPGKVSLDRFIGK